MTTTTRYSLGRLEAKFPVALTALHNLITFGPTAESCAGPDDSAFHYGMLGNDQYGDCTFAGFVHLVQATCLLLGTTPPSPTSPEVVQAYLLFTHGQDMGAVEADVLAALYSTGILGVKLAGYANGLKGIPELLQIIQYGGAAYLGVMVPMPMQDQFQAGELIDLTNTSADNDIEGGHCIDGIAFDQAAETVDVLTWGSRVKVTFRWLDRYLDEQWMVIPQQVKDAGQLEGMDWAHLTADMESLHGVVAP